MLVYCPMRALPVFVIVDNDDTSLGSRGTWRSESTRTVGLVTRSTLANPLKSPKRGQRPRSTLKAIKAAPLYTQHEMTMAQAAPSAPKYGMR